MSLIFVSPPSQWMSEGKTEASIYQQAEDGKTELSLMHFAINNPQWQPPQETTHFISQLKERVHREATGAPADTHPLSLSESEVWRLINCRFKVIFPHIFRCKFRFNLSYPDSALSLIAKEPCCRPLGRPFYTGLCSFWQGQLFDQSRWHQRWSICLSLPFPNQQQSAPEGQFECCSQDWWPHFSHEQSNGRLWVRKCSLWKFFMSNTKYSMSYCFYYHLTLCMAMFFGCLSSCKDGCPNCELRQQCVGGPTHQFGPLRVCLH